MKNKTNALKKRLYIIIFQSDTKLGFLFDILLIITILLGATIMMLDSIKSIHQKYYLIFDYIEWSLTALFLIEYMLRVYCSDYYVGSRRKYIFSFFGVIDFLCVFPSFLGLILRGSQYLVVIRLLRVLRIFRILRLVKFLEESYQLLTALRMSMRKIMLFIFAEGILTTVFGSIIYAVEGESNGFTSIPKSIYWAIVTMTTVGYGDISPQTNLGQSIAAIAMIVAYSIVVISAGMIGMDFASLRPQASKKNHPNNDAAELSPSKQPMHYCPFCGEKLPN